MDLPELWTVHRNDYIIVSFDPGLQAGMVVLTPLLAGDEVLEEVDRDRLHGRQVRLDVDGHEREDLCNSQLLEAEQLPLLTSLAPELGGERRGRDLHGCLLLFDLRALH